MRTDTQDTILNAVQSVIVRDGVGGASMRQVASEADVSLGLISYHFDDKDSLIVEAFRRAASKCLAVSIDAAAKAVTPEDKVRRFLRGGFSPEFLNSDYLSLRVALWAVALTDPQLAVVDTEYNERYCSAMRDLIGLARPDLDVLELSNRTSDIMAHTNGLWLDWARLKNDDIVERGLARSEKLALAD